MARPFSSKSATPALFVTVASLLGMTVSGIAQADATAAEEHLKRGVDLRRERRDTEALQEFRLAYQEEPTPRARGQIALAEYSLEQWVAAENELRAALDAKADPWIARHRASLDDALTHISEHLGWLDVEANVPGAVLSVDGVVIGPLPLSSRLRMPIGKVTIRVDADGYAPIERAVAIMPSTQTSTLVLLPTSGQTVPAEEPAAASPTDGAHAGTTPTDGAAHASSGSDASPAIVAAGYSMVGLGIGAIAVGTYFGLATLGDRSARDAQCQGVYCSSQGLAYDATARREATVSTIAFSIGAVATIGGAIVLWRSRATSSPRGSLAPITVAASPSAAGGSIRLSGTW